MRAAGGVAPSALQLLLDVAHSAAEILVGARPARRMDPGRAAERVDHEAGVVGERRKPGGLRRGCGLDQSVLGKGRAGLLGLGEAELAGRDRRDAVGREEFAHLGELAWVMGRDHEPSGDGAMTLQAMTLQGHSIPESRISEGEASASCRYHITASFCRSMSLPTPLRASASMSMNCASVNGVFSAVPWISTMPPFPVSTKLASVSAAESSA